MILLDSCIVIDCLRGRQPAVDYLQSLSEPPALSVVTIMEIFAGMHKSEESRFLAVVNNSTTINIDFEISKASGILLKTYRRSHNLDPPDALIAATVLTHNLELATFNLKHFPMFPDLKRPY